VESGEYNHGTVSSIILGLLIVPKCSIIEHVYNWSVIISIKPSGSTSQWHSNENVTDLDLILRQFFLIN